MIKRLLVVVLFIPCLVLVIPFLPIAIVIYIVTGTFPEPQPLTWLMMLEG